jgi:hypothetical protein
MELYYAIDFYERDDCELLVKKFTNLEYINKGAYGKVFQVCNKETLNCNYVLKVIIFDKYTYELSGSE